MLSKTYLFSIIIMAVLVVAVEAWLFSRDHEMFNRIMLAQKFLFIETVLVLLSIFVWQNISEVFSHGRAAKNVKIIEFKFCSIDFIWKSMTLAYLFLAHCSYVASLFLAANEPYTFTMLAYFMLGLHVQLFLSIGVLKTFNFLVKITTKCQIRHKHLMVLAVLYAVSITLSGIFNAQRPPVVTHVTIPVKDLPRSLDGLTITHIPDIHIGLSGGKSDLDDIVRTVNDLNTDMTVIVGDLVDGSTQRLGNALDSLKNLKSRMGTYFVTGNHEYYTLDVDSWVVSLESMGIQTLHNSHINIPRDVPPTEQICLTGVDDIEAEKMSFFGHGFDFDKAVAGCSPDQPVILLAHQPKAAQRALQSQHRLDLVLSGHTHGGQFFPMTLVIYLLNPFFKGLYRYGDNSHVYVSQGAMGFPVRIMTQREISIIELTKL